MPAWTMVGWMPLYRGANFLANSRFASLRSQYQASVMISPWEVCSPSACTSVMKASSAARFWPPRTMPNADARLIELIVSAPALASPMILAPRCLRLQQERREVGGRERMADMAQHLAAILDHDRRGVALERVTEGVVGGQEEPGVV